MEIDGNRDSWSILIQQACSKVMVSQRSHCMNYRMGSRTKISRFRKSTHGEQFIGMFPHPAVPIEGLKGSLTKHRIIQVVNWLGEEASQKIHVHCWLFIIESLVRKNAPWKSAHHWLTPETYPAFGFQFLQSYLNLFNISIYNMKLCIHLMTHEV